MATKDEIIRLVTEVLEQAPGSVSLEDHFLDDLGASSLDIVTLVMRIEAHYGLGETPDEELEQIGTVGDLVGIVEAMRYDDEPSEAYELLDIVIASDHNGVDLKAELIEWFRDQKYTYMDLGPGDVRSVDYPDFAALVAKRLQKGDADKGILICGSGIGMSIAANRFQGVRAALVNEPLSAKMARVHNNANVLCLGADFVGSKIAKACIEEFMTTSFDPGSDGRHRRRVSRMDEF